MEAESLPAPGAPAQSALPGDYYTTDEGFVVFTAEYLRRRGTCCHNGCRHCPYRESEVSKS